MCCVLESIEQVFPLFLQVGCQVPVPNQWRPRETRGTVARTIQCHNWTEWLWGTSLNCWLSAFVKCICATIRFRGRYEIWSQVRRCCYEDEKCWLTTLNRWTSGSLLFARDRGFTGRFSWMAPEDYHSSGCQTKTTADTAPPSSPSHVEFCQQALT